MTPGTAELREHALAEEQRITLAAQRAAARFRWASPEAEERMADIVAGCLEAQERDDAAKTAGAA